MSAADAIEVSAYRAALLTYQRIVAAHVGSSLAGARDDDAHEQARSLAQSLYQAGLDIGAELDDFLTRYTDVGPEFAYKPPSERAALFSDEPPF